MDSLLGEFIGYLKANWSDNSRVDQRRPRLRQLVAKLRAVTDAAEGTAAVRQSSIDAWLQLLRTEALRGEQVLNASNCDAAAVAGSLRQLLTGIKRLVVPSAEVDRLAKAVEDLERLAGPGGDLDLFVKVLRLDGARATTMDVDGGPEAVSDSSSSAAAYVLPVTARKRKRASGSPGGSPSLDSADQCKRRVLTREPPPPPQAARSREAAVGDFHLASERSSSLLVHFGRLG